MLAWLWPVINIIGIAFCVTIVTNPRNTNGILIVGWALLIFQALMLVFNVYAAINQ